uniref:Uncharacterized protein n=1 Tax=Triticum urartu TaxID=4572 RepID=A0A8R7UE11_TRIUA
MKHSSLAASNNHTWRRSGGQKLSPKCSFTHGCYCKIGIGLPTGSIVVGGLTARSARFVTRLRKQHCISYLLA